MPLHVDYIVYSYRCSPSGRSDPCESWCFMRSHMHTYMPVSFYCTLLGCLSNNSSPSGSVFLSDMAISMKSSEGKSVYMHIWLKKLCKQVRNECEIKSSIVTVIGQSRCIYSKWDSVGDDSSVGQ